MRHTTLPTIPPREVQSMPSDEQLMEQIRNDDEQALDALIRRYWSYLVWYAATKLPDRDEAEDVAQGVFVRLWEHRRRWDRKGSVKAFLFRIARNLIIDHTRHQEVRDRHDPELVPLASSIVTPIDAAAQREFQEAFERVLGSLPERRREAFILVRTLGLGLQETADVMGVTRRTVANHVYLAVQDLQERLGCFIS